MKRATPWKIAKITGCLTLAALLACPGQTAAAGSPKAKAAVKAPANGAKFTVLNPEAPLSEIETKALSPRLTNFAGKTIVIYDTRGGYEKPMKGLAEQLKPLLLPDTKLVYYEPVNRDPTPADLASIPKGDAVIVGHGF
jgi:ABC-type oligopeptide transport system substrate-binding subunit